MMNRTMLGIVLATVLASFVYAQPFTYQGMLKQNGSPVTDTLSMTFTLYDALDGGNQIGLPITQDVPVENGLFTVTLDFGNVWNGADRYLEITVGSTVLSPRVKINPVPYASFAQRPWQKNGSTIFYADGQVGIGTSNPSGLVSLGGSEGNKLVVWDGGGPLDVMGLGMAPGQFRFYVPHPGNRFSFLNAPNGTEIMTILGSGNVGIGTSSPFAPLSLGGGNANTKLALWQGNTAADVMGFGIAPHQFRIHLHHPGNRFSFLNAPAGDELVTIRGMGEGASLNPSIDAPSHNNQQENSSPSRTQALL